MTGAQLADGSSRWSLPRRLRAVSLRLRITVLSWRILQAREMADESHHDELAARAAEMWLRRQCCGLRRRLERIEIDAAERRPS